MDRRGFLLFGAVALCGGLTSGWREIEPSSDVVGRTRTAAGLLSLVQLGDRDNPYLDPSPGTFSGTGAGAAEFDSDGGFTMVLATHDGEGPFTVTASEPGGEPVTLVEATGAGTVLTGIPMAATTYDLDIEADREWELTLAQPDTPAEEIREPPARATGTGNAVVGPLDTRNDPLVSAVHEGDGEFSVRLLLEAGTGVFDPETLIDGTGRVDSEARTATAGVVWAVVEATGSWTVEFEA